MRHAVTTSSGIPRAGRGAWMKSRRQGSRGAARVRSSRTKTPRSFRTCRPASKRPCACLPPSPVSCPSSESPSFGITGPLTWMTSGFATRRPQGRFDHWRHVLPRGCHAERVALDHTQLQGDMGTGRARVQSGPLATAGRGGEGEILHPGKENYLHRTLGDTCADIETTVGSGICKSI